MNLFTTLIEPKTFFNVNSSPISKRVSVFFPVRLPLTITKCSRANVPLAAEATTRPSPPPPPPPPPPPVVAPKMQAIEEEIEKVIYRCRFLAIFGVWGSLLGSFLCFVKGCTYVGSSFMEYFVNRGKVILLLVEAIDVYLLGTVMLVFGMGLYELFVSNLDTAKLFSGDRVPNRSNLFGLFTLKERPRWLEIKTVNDLKTKLGHVIVMLLLIGFFEKSKTAVIQSPMDLLCFSAAVFLCSGCLYLLSKLHG
ncbi:uncharacterized protein LOC8280143 [Ricinus communis]|uniref:uncharacterized protein LOC8280143 n=1 Tax=Ricinus communis TaxID=3988 RepID=UPI00077230F0|nr:uncharacterized protein LOC8280143 [Ricinus communis]|eukprot:XP_015575056.1 uncharacterized protein LOC8280143 [Ricinus communis]